MFTLDTWKEKFQNHLPGWRERMQRAGVKSVYAFISASALWPVAQTFLTDMPAAFMALGGVLAGIGGNLLANLIQSRKDEIETAKQIETELAQNPALHIELDAVLQKLEALPLAQQHLAAADHLWFVEILREELQRLGNFEKFAAELQGTGAIAQGTEAKAVGARGALIEGSMSDSVLVTGDRAEVIGRDKTEISVNAEKGATVVIGEAQTPADWESHYLRTLINLCDPLDLTLIDETQAQAGEVSAVSVSEVFTTLYLARLTRAPKQKVEAAIRRPEEPDVHQKIERDEKRLPIQAVEAVAAMPRLVILGQPGGGKSTLVNHLVTQLAQKRLGKTIAKGKLPGWRPDEKPLPVRIVLRRFAAWLPPETKRGSAGLVWNYIEQQLEQCGCKEFFPTLKQRLTKEAGAVFFDGLDEVHETDAEAKRSLITQAIAEFAAPLAKCRVVVTCREYAYRQSQAWQLPKKDFPDVELDLFGEEQIEHFTRTWYQIVGPQKGWDEAKCRDEAKNLFQAIHEWPHLQALGKYPLLLTLMAQVHGRDGSLPNDRADLYERAVNLLLAHWQNRLVRDVSGSRKLEPGLIVQLGVRTETLRSALERVAFAAHERQEKMPGRSENAADIPKEDLREELESALGNADKAKQVLAYIQERAGLLQAHDLRTYRFPHRTFQEYLTATYLLKQGEYDTMLRDRMKRDLIWWREVFLLAAGASRSTPRNISDLVDGLVQHAPTPETLTPDKTAQLQAAAQALAETGFIERVRGEKEPGRFAATYDKIQNGLLLAMRSDRALAATERAAAGNALARLGDPRFRADAWFLPDELLLGFVEIPAGTFRMGSDKKKDTKADDDETPQHSIDLPTYYLARYPVTVAQFQSFVNASGYKPKDPQSLQGLPNHPVVYVTWHEARTYCEWLTEQLRAWKLTPEPLASLLVKQGWCISLPSEAEWEKASRGVDGRIYPWGNDADPNRANYSDNGIGATSVVGCFPGGASPFGCEEMSGNVWEWTRSLWGKNWEKPDFKYPYQANDGREQLDAPDDVLRVLRGGSFANDASGVRCAYRDRYNPHYRDRRDGFRLSARPLSF